MLGKLRTVYRKALPVNLRLAVRRLLPFNPGFADKPGNLGREYIANKYLQGEGIEIGALNLPLRVPEWAKVKYVDRLSIPDLKKQYPEIETQGLTAPDIVDDGELLETVADASQDFVIANHFIEHCQNPLLALKNMFRVLKPKGILYLGVPDKRFTFDVDRPVTPLQHILEDYQEGPARSKQMHFEEWVRVVEKVGGETDAEKRVNELLEQDYSIHYHVWTQAEMLEMIAEMARQFNVRFDLELFFKNGQECIFILRKSE